ncbi:hypothetical protein JCM17960_32370 [Magnetospira thiophila]
MPLIPFMIAGGLAMLLTSFVLLLFGGKSKEKAVIEGIEMDDDKDGEAHPDETVVVTTEDVPLDNREGSDTLISEHSFSCTAESHLSMERTTETNLFVEQGVVKIIEAGLAHSLEKSLGMKVGVEESRGLHVTFKVAPKTKVLYRIIWKQRLHKGNLVLKKGSQRLKLPFTVTHGLTHEVEALPVESAKKS